jgi:3-oxoacyl-[acyl-carrier protein] reductase
MTLPDFTLKGKIALVTGAKRGIGKGIAVTFAEAGADVAVCGRNVTELEPVAREVRALGRKAVAIQCDVSQKNQVHDMVATIIAELGPIDVLVNNAVVYTRGALVELPESDWDRSVNASLKGYYLCAQEVVNTCMIPRRKGCIICLGSTAGIRPTGRQGAYSIIKAGAIMMSKLLAVELAEYGIRVNALAPTVVKTENTNEELLRGFMTQLPLGRLTELRELTAAALFLASDAASYISGHTLIVDGGRVNTWPRPRAG